MMASAIKWIKIVTDIFDDEKILLIESLPEADTIIVVWFKLLTLAGKQNYSGVLMMNDRIHYTDEMLATLFRRPLNTVRAALQTFEQFGMIEIINNAITIPNWEKHQSVESMEKAREQARKRVARYREKQKQLANSNVTCNVTVTQGNALEEEVEIDKEIDIDNTTTTSEKNLFDYYQQRIGALDGFQYEKLKEYLDIDKLEPELIKRAIDRAADNAKRNFNYVNAILKNWAKNDIKTIVQQDEEQRNFIDRKSGSFQNGNNPQHNQTNVPDWANEEVRNEQTEEGQARLAELYAELEAMENGET
ncbi:TPA: phage replisome organizer N-terminal domain-containing protein [Streptococcus suis]|nr:phage replisome organizer N-terminal domain-containing protein [Streptococcus suis]HEM6345113.1 phage replisome organizer N-terminal domain-containing protein [Streptococcus suis]